MAYMAAASTLSTGAFLAVAVALLNSGASAQTAQEVPVRSCPDLMDFYPQRALREELSGKVSYSLTIGPVGQVLEIAMDKSSGHDLLDQAGIKFLQRCRFLPTNNPNALVRKTTRSVNFVIPQ